MALVQCYYDYARSEQVQWLFYSLENRFQTTQNKMIRFVFNLDSKTQTDIEHFKHLSLLPVEERNHHLMLCHVLSIVFKVRNSLAPGYMDDFFVAQDTVHRYNLRLRNKGGFGLPKVKGSGSKSFRSLSTISIIKRLRHYEVAVKDYLINGPFVIDILFV